MSENLPPQPSKYCGSGRVLALVTEAFGGYGGIAQYNRDFLSALAHSFPAVEFDVLPRLATVPTGPLPPNMRQHAPVLERFSYALMATHHVLRRRPTIIFNGHIYHSPLARYLAKCTGATLISQVHGTEVWSPLSKQQIKTLEMSRIVLSVSRDTRIRLLAKAKIDPGQAIVLNNTVGAAFTPGDRISARKRFQVSGEFAILTVARLDSRGGYKGHDRVMPLIAHLVSKGRELVYLIAGSGPDRPRLERLAANLGISKRVRFLGRVPEEALPDLYRAADLFALPSTGEGFGIAFLEAMACGTPAVGLAVGGAVDAFADGALGACVEPELFSEAFTQLIEAPRPHSTLLSTAVHERFGKNAFRNNCEHLFRTILNSPTGTPDHRDNIC